VSLEPVSFAGAVQAEKVAVPKCREVNYAIHVTVEEQCLYHNSRKEFWNDCLKFLAKEITMNITRVFSIGVVAAGLTCVAGYANASDNVSGKSTFPGMLVAEGTGTGSGSGKVSGSTDPDKKGGSSGMEKRSPTTPEAGKSKQGTGTSMDSGKSGNAGSSGGMSGKSSGDSDSYGGYYGPPPGTGSGASQSGSGLSGNSGSPEKEAK
jgi:hypothetical protein